MYISVYILTTGSDRLALIYESWQEIWTTAPMAKHINQFREKEEEKKKADQFGTRSPDCMTHFLKRAQSTIHEYALYLHKLRYMALALAESSHLANIYNIFYYICYSPAHIAMSWPWPPTVRIQFPLCSWLSEKLQPNSKSFSVASANLWLFVAWIWLS